MSELRHITRIKNTEALVRANLDLAQSAILTDGDEWWVYNNDDASKLYYVANQYQWDGSSIGYIDNDFNAIVAHSNVDIEQYLRLSSATDNRLNFQDGNITTTVRGVDALVCEDSRIYTLLNVGIGTNTPFVRTSYSAPWLTIASNGPGINLKDSDNADANRFFSNSAGVLNIGVSDDDGTNPIVHLRIAADGNVSLQNGTSINNIVASTAYTDTDDCVWTGANIIDYVATQVSGGTYWDRAGTVLTPKTNGDDLSLDADNSYLKFGAAGDAGITYNGTNMVFDSQLVGGGDFVYSGGNVAIGMNSPSYILDVQGDIRIKNLTGNSSLLYSAPLAEMATIIFQAADVNKWSLRRFQNDTFFGLYNYAYGNDIIKFLPAGTVQLPNDNSYLKFGAAQDAGITYDGTNMVFDSQLVGTGDFVFSGGNVGIGTATPDDDKLSVYYAPVNDTWAHGQLITYRPSATSTGTYYNRGLEVNVKLGVSSGVTNSGYTVGAHLGVLTASNFEGTLASQYGLRIQHGHEGGTGTIINTYGIMIDNYHTTGTITNQYGLYMSKSTGGTITNRWGLYIVDDADNYFAGNVGIGTTPNTLWDTDYTVLQMPGNSAISAVSGGELYLSTNVLYDEASSRWEYTTTGTNVGHLIQNAYLGIELLATSNAAHTAGNECDWDATTVNKFRVGADITGTVINWNSGDYDTIVHGSSSAKFMFFEASSSNLGLNTYAPLLNVGSSAGDFSGIGMHIKAAGSTPSYLILEGDSNFPNGGGNGAGGIIFCDDNGAADEKMMSIGFPKTETSQKMYIYGLDDDTDVDTTAVVIDCANGRLGIGKDPSYALDISLTTDDLAIDDANDNSDICSSPGGWAKLNVGGATKYVQFYDSPTS